jgi:hypothetical protein
VEFVSGRMPHIVLGWRWCSIKVLNIHAPCEDKSDEVKDSSCKELERIFDQFHGCNMTILYGDFSAKVGSKHISTPKIGNESSHEIGNDNRVRIVNFVTSKNLIVKRTMFPHRDIHKYTWISTK